MGKIWSNMLILRQKSLTWTNLYSDFDEARTRIQFFKGSKSEPGSDTILNIYIQNSETDFFSSQKQPKL